MDTVLPDICRGIGRAVAIHWPEPAPIHLQPAFFKSVEITLLCKIFTRILNLPTQTTAWLFCVLYSTAFYRTMVPLTHFLILSKSVHTTLVSAVRLIFGPTTFPPHLSPVLLVSSPYATRLVSHPV